MSRNLQCCSILLFVCIVGLFSNSLVFPVTCSSLEDQKAYYAPPDPPSTPVYGTPPPHRVSPPRGHGGSPPHHNPTPSPPTNCVTPPSDPTPSRPSTPPSGGHYNSPPPTPVYVSPPSTPTPIVPVTPTPLVPVTPSPLVPITPSPLVPITPSPLVPITPSPLVPITPITPSPIIPGIPTTPTTPFPFDPNSPFGGPCNFWRSNPTFIWGIVGWYAPLGSLGIPSAPGFPSTINPLQALSNPRTDGFGALYREGTASFLNSMVNHRFPFTTSQVRNNFIAALSSEKAAGAQARVFKKANEGHLKPKA